MHFVTQPILVVVDNLSKMINLTPTTIHFTGQGTARLLVDNVIKLHGILEDIVSDSSLVAS